MNLRALSKLLAKQMGFWNLKLIINVLLSSNEAALRGLAGWLAGESPTAIPPGGSQGREPSRSVSRFNLGGRGYIRAAFVIPITPLTTSRCYRL